MHPDARAAVGRHIQPVGAAERLVLGDFVGVMDFPVIDAAGVDIERETQQLAGHYRAFEMPSRRAHAPGRIPFHLPLLTRRGLAPDGKIGRMALAFHGFDPPFPFIGPGARKAAVIVHGRNVEIEPAIQLITVLVGDGLRKLDHLRHVFRGDRPFSRLADVQRRDVRPVSLGVMSGDIPDRLGTFGRHLLHLVLTGIGIVGQVPDIGDVDDVSELVALERQRAAQHIGEDIGAHVADVRVIVDCRSAAVDARFAGVDRLKGFRFAGKAVEQHERRSIGHGRAPYAGHAKGQGT